MVPTKITMKTYLLKCGAVKYGTQTPKRRRKMVSPSWHHLQKLSYSEEGHSALIRNVSALLPSFIVSQHTTINFIIRSGQSNHETGYPGVFSSVCHASLDEFIDTSRERTEIVVNFCHGVGANALTAAYKLPLDCFCLHSSKSEILCLPNDSTNFGMRGGDGH
jgi:hypothetical protein